MATSIRKTTTLMATRALVADQPAPPHHGAALPAVARLLPGDHARTPRAAALLGHALGAAKADRRRHHALMTDWPAAVRATHPGLALGVAVAVLDIEIVGHVHFEILDRGCRAHEGGRHSCARATRSAIQPSMRTGRMVSRATTAWRVEPLAISVPGAPAVAAAVPAPAAPVPAPRRLSPHPRRRARPPRRRRGAPRSRSRTRRGRRDRSTWRRRAGRRRARGSGRCSSRSTAGRAAAALDFGDRHAHGAQRLDARDLEVDEVVRVVDHAGGVGPS